MKENKEGEQIITEAYEEHIKQKKIACLRYEFFDLHTECKGGKYENINPIIIKLSPMNENFRFYAEETSNNLVVMT